MTTPLRYLIVNADDFNLTQGVSRAILKAHDEGVVTSTTVFINLDMPVAIRKECLRRKRLGKGLHLNVTYGRPVSRAAFVTSLIDSSGKFRRKHDFQSVARADLLAEYEAQIELFAKRFGSLPTHLDTHHHVHADPIVFEVVQQLALLYRLPLRLSSRLQQAERAVFKRAGISLPDGLIEDLSSSKAWRVSSLTRRVTGLRRGVTELMCHPGMPDKILEKISSFSVERVRELEALCSPEIRYLMHKRRIQLISYKDLKRG